MSEDKALDTIREVIWAISQPTAQQQMPAIDVADLRSPGGRRHRSLWVGRGVRAARSGARDPRRRTRHRRDQAPAQSVTDLVFFPLP